MSKMAELKVKARACLRRYKAFSGHDLDISKTPCLSNDLKNEVFFAVGKITGIEYKAKRSGKTEKYFHKFRLSSAPTLYVSSNGKQLYIHDGKYLFTKLGIEDR